jgi:CP12 domain
MSKNEQLEKKIEAERTNAREACDINGVTSGVCAAAWDAVEELQAEASHQRESQTGTEFNEYCDNNPDAVECRVYEN